MFGWFSEAPTLASRWKRRATSSALSACSRLMATSRSRRQSLARNTVAIPPAPRRFCIRYRSAINSPVIPTGMRGLSPLPEWGKRGCAGLALELQLLAGLALVASGVGAARGGLERDLLHTLELLALELDGHLGRALLERLGLASAPRLLALQSDLELAGLVGLDLELQLGPELLRAQRQRELRLQLVGRRKRDDGRRDVADRDGHLRRCEPGPHGVGEGDVEGLAVIALGVGRDRHGDALGACVAGRPAQRAGGRGEVGAGGGRPGLRRIVDARCLREGPAAADDDRRGGPLRHGRARPRGLEQRVRRGETLEQRRAGANGADERGRAGREIDRVERGHGPGLDVRE